MELNDTVDSDGDGLTDSEGRPWHQPIGCPVATHWHWLRMGPRNVAMDAATNYTLDDGSTVMGAQYDDSNDNGKGQTEYH